MNTSSTGSRRTAGDPEPLHPLTARLFINTKLECLVDCVKRASDGMERDDENRIDWTYVAGQIIAAENFLLEAQNVAIDMADQQDLRNELQESPAGRTDTRSSVDQLTAAADKGGEA